MSAPAHRIFVGPGNTIRVMCGGLLLLALAAVPTPLLPPQVLVGATQSLLGTSGKTAYFLAAMGLQAAFYLSLGALGALAVRRERTLGGRLRQALLVPAAVIAVAVLIRSMKAGHLPVWVNAVVPTAACLLGVALGLGFLYRRWKATLTVAVAVIGATLLAWHGGRPSSLGGATGMRLQRLATLGSPLPDGDAWFALLVHTAFMAVPNEAGHASAIEENRAAIVALGIAVGDERLARLVGLERDTALLRQVLVIGAGATLRGRSDWSKHYTVSAALAVLKHPLASDAAGLMKEQLDALTRDSGFSFGDIAADRAGVRFAAAATSSDASARALQSRLQGGFVVDDFFPLVADLPEMLSVEQFRRDYGGVGSSRYRQLIEEIEQRLDRCPGLSSGESGDQGSCTTCQLESGL